MNDIQNYTIYSLPLIAAAIGWFTNYLAVKMLFHPRKPLRIFFITIQGVFPKRQEALAKKLGNLVATELLNEEDLAKGIAGGLDKTELLKSISEKVRIVLTEDLPKRFPMISMILNPELIAIVQKSFAENISEAISTFVQKLGKPTSASLNIEAIVEEKVKNFSSDKLEDILFSLMKKEFRFIELSGAVLGFFIGVIQLLLVQSAQ